MLFLSFSLPSVSSEHGRQVTLHDYALNGEYRLFRYLIVLSVGSQVPCMSDAGIVRGGFELIVHSSLRFVCSQLFVATCMAAKVYSTSEYVANALISVPEDILSAAMV